MVLYNLKKLKWSPSGAVRLETLDGEQMATSLMTTIFGSITNL